MKRVRKSLFLVVALGLLAQSGSALADVIGLEIIGPREVAENFSAGYKAIAFYDDSSTMDVTNLALWAVEPNIAANIDEKGVLTTKDVAEEQSVTILTSYSEGDVTFDADKVVNIFPAFPGAALYFDGVDDYVEIPDSDSLNPTNEITISFWVYHNGCAGIYKYAFCPNARYSPGNSRSYYLIVNYGTNQVVLRIHSTVRTGDSFYSNNAVGLNEWHHVTGTFNRGKAEIYIDGELDNSTTMSVSSIMDDVQPLFIGGLWSYCGADHWVSGLEGIVDEVAIYNRALSAEEIQARISRHLTGEEPGLVGYWDFDEGQGQFVYDLSGNGNHGCLGGDPCAVEESDPMWIESDAPIGICSFYQIATVFAGNAVERKTALLEELPAVLHQEWTVYEALEEWLESGDYGDLNYGDIVTAKQKIHSAIQHESQQSIGSLEKSVEKLKDALISLGYEPEPLTLNQEALALSDLECREPVPVADVNTDFAEEFAPFMSIEPYELAVIRTEDMIARKFEVMEKISAELEKEWAAYEALEEWLESGDYGDLNYGDIVTAKQKIYSAMQHEEQSIDALKKSIEKLEDVLSALGYDPPGQATNPNPANGSIDVDIDADLSWTAGPKAVSHDIYFGTANPPPFIGNQTAATFDPGTMIGNMRYYWRIDEVNSSWTTSGTVWTFTTILPSPPPPP